MTPKFRLVHGEKVRALPASGEIVVGSAEGCEVRLGVEGVDERHARIECSRSGARIVDLASSTGTRVNGDLVSRSDLRSGDRITIGGVTFTFEDAAAPKPSPEVVVEISPALQPASDPIVEIAPELEAASEPIPEVAAAPADRRSAPRPPRPGGAVRRSRKAPVGILVVAGVVVVGLIVVLVVASGGSDPEPDEARALYRQAQTRLEEGDEESAWRLLEEITQSWPQSSSAEDAEILLLQIGRLRERERRARTELARVWALRATVPRNDLLDRFEEIRETTRATRALEAFGDIEKRIDEHYDGVRSRAFEEARTEATLALEEGRFGEALVAWREYFRLPVGVPKDRDGARLEVDRILKRAEKEYLEAVHASASLADEGKFDEALARITVTERKLAGTRFAANARMEAEAVLLARAEAGGEASVSAPAATAERREALESLQEAELLAKARRYGEAARAYAKHLAAASEPTLKSEIAGRKGELEDLAWLLAELRRQIGSSPERFEGIPLGGDILGKAVGADEEGLNLELPRGTSRILWRRLTDSRLHGLLERLKLDGSGRIALARFCLLVGDEDRAHELLVEAAEAGAPEERIQAVLARARRMDVPDGGFVVYRGRWFTPSERDAAALRDRIADLARKAGGSDRRRAEEALAQLREIGEPAREALVVALDARRGALRKKLFEMAAGNPGLVANLVKSLKEARQHALSLIYDTKKYPYDRSQPNPYGPNGAEVQRDVNERVAKVRGIWENPLGHVAEKWPDLRTVMDELAAVDGEAAELSRTEPRLPTILTEARDRIGLGAAADGKTQDRAYEVMMENAKVEADVVNDEERACIRAVNEYRRMMGLGPVRISPELIEASRQHSTEMAEMNYFAHESPVPANRTPGHRARNADFRGGGISENIARGATTGRDAHRQWTQSSGHHRNILGRGHSEIGVGQAQQSWWTEMFGRGSGR